MAPIMRLRNSCSGFIFRTVKAVRHVKWSLLVNIFTIQNYVDKKCV